MVNGRKGERERERKSEREDVSEPDKEYTPAAAHAERPLHETNWLFDSNQILLSGRTWATRATSKLSLKRTCAQQSKAQGPACIKTA